ncbi:hypothetical protein RvY_17920 [Ramazzottius varieornatus]|uniref:Guanylate cyclase n=1 Tax=Ramazzottius varieornatus TaxID=947166 RepID=A0A1D1W3X1_RAMVA|nr:hypothetical protein RvY_17920 [Ramazzottius varieornatus]
MTATILSRSVGMTEEKAKSRMADTSGSSVAPMDYAALEDRIGKVYLYHGMPLQARQLPEPRQRDSYNVHREVKLVQMLQHWNLQKIVGILIDDDNKCQAVLGELCSRGTLHHLIHDDKFDLDFQFKYSLVENLVSGMAYLQTTVVKSHGILSSFHCLIDGRFVLKISGYGMPVLVSPNWLVPPTDNMSDKQLYFYLWRAPEHLRERMPPSGSQKGDIYSFAIIVQQILLQSDPFKMGKLSENRSSVPVRDIVMEVKRGSTPPLRPPLPASVTAPEMRDLLEECWQEDPSLRPSFAMFKASMLQMLVRNKISTVGLVDHLIKKMEKYSLELEKQVEQKTNQFMEEKERSRNILDQILPKSIAKSLIQGTISAPETFECVTVCFADIPGFANFVKSLASRPHDYLDALNILQDTYETIVEQRDVFRVECLYDALLLVSGLPNRNGTHATEIAETAVGLLKSVANTKLSLAPSHILRLRVGMHTGPCVAGIVGSKLPKYCIFGDTVNTASRMETNSIAGKIQCTQKTKELLPESPLFKVVHRGNIEVKGKGLMDVYWIEPQL